MLPGEGDTPGVPALGWAGWNAQDMGTGSMMLLGVRPCPTMLPGCRGEKAELPLGLRSSSLWLWLLLRVWRCMGVPPLRRSPCAVAATCLRGSLSWLCVWMYVIIALDPSPPSSNRSMNFLAGQSKSLDLEHRKYALHIAET